MKGLNQALCVLVTLLLAACTSSTAITPQIKTITIDVKEFEYTPTLIKVTAGETIQIKIANSGSVLHDFSIQKIGLKDKAISAGDKHDMSGMPGMSMDEPAVHVAVNSGKTGTVTFTPVEAGEYEFFCTVAGHKAAGLAGKLIVVVP